MPRPHRFMHAPGLIASLPLLVLTTLSLSSARAQSAPAPATAAPAPADAQPFSQEQLEQMLAPIALYPDSLLAQVLMASTYPLEIVEAERWAKSNASLSKDALATALETQAWDPSVKSLVNFPDVLTMLSDKLSWTQQLGDAFIGQQKQVMDAVQSLRSKANDTGNLKSSAEQNVTVSNPGPTQTIVIESASPEIIYVPAYNPTIVYGTWPYPAYPPYPYYPPGYVVSNAISFGVGVACGVAWGYAWGNCNWHGGDIDIDINRNVNFNTHIDRSRTNINSGAWQHNPAHRDGVPYRDQVSARQFGGTSTSQAAAAREQYRGRAEAGRADLARGDADQFRQPGAADRAAQQGRAAERGTTRPTSAGNSAFGGAGADGRTARAQSERGNTSRAASSRSSGAGRSSGVSRSGGGSRGGGRGGRR